MNDDYLKILKASMVPKEYFDFIPGRETLEEAAQRYKSLKLPDDLYDGFIAGAKWWNTNQTYIDMQEYSEFCVRCDREGLPLLSAKDWVEQFKKK